MAPPTVNEGRGSTPYKNISSDFSTHLLHQIATTASIEEEGSVIELGSHADSPVVGKHAHILRRTGKQMNVSGFTDQINEAIPDDVVDAAMS